MNRFDYGQKICTGKFDGSGSIYYYDWNHVHHIHPYEGISWTIILSAVFLMVCVKIGGYKMKQNEPVRFVHSPKSMESILLNFTLMILLMTSFFLNELGWKKYGPIFTKITTTF